MPGRVPRQRCAEMPSPAPMKARAGAPHHAKAGEKIDPSQVLVESPEYFAPMGLAVLNAPEPTAYAVGYILTPLRGCAACIHVRYQLAPLSRLRRLGCEGTNLGWIDKSGFRCEGAFSVDVQTGEGLRIPPMCVVGRTCGPILGNRLVISSFDKRRRRRAGTRGAR